MLFHVYSINFNKKKLSKDFINDNLIQGTATRHPSILLGGIKSIKDTAVAV